MSREEKQDYLRKEILECGYDGATFLAFCEEYKPDSGSDIDAWKMEDLKLVVQKYKEQEKKEIEEITKNFNYDDKSQDEKFNERFSRVYGTQNQGSSEQIQQNKEEDEKYLQLLQQQQNQADDNFDLRKVFLGLEMSEKVSCKKMEETELSQFLVKNPNEQLQINIVSYNIKEEGFLHSSYAIYRIQTQPLNWEVQRRYNEFVWLRECLVKQFPGYLIPPLPRKKKIRSFDTIYLEKRSKVLQNFLDYIASHKILRASQCFNDFLSLYEDAAFQSRKKELANKIKDPGAKVCEFQTPDGKIDIEINDDYRQYAQGFSDFISNVEQLYSKIKKQTKMLFVEMDSVSGSIMKIGDHFELLHDNMQLFNKTVPIGKFPQQERTYKILSQFCNSWGVLMVDQMRIVKEHLHEFFRFQTKMNNQYKEYLKKRNDLSNSFNDQIKKINEKKEKLFLQQDTSKWEIPQNCPKSAKDLLANKSEAFQYMLFNETEQIKHNGQFYGFFNKQFFTDTQHYIENKHVHYGKKFISMQQNMAINITETHHLLADTISLLSDLLGLKVVSLNVQQPAQTKYEAIAIQQQKNQEENDEEKKNLGNNEEPTTQSGVFGKKVPIPVEQKPVVVQECEKSDFVIKKSTQNNNITQSLYSDTKKKDYSKKEVEDNDEDDDDDNVQNLYKNQQYHSFYQQEKQKSPPQQAKQNVGNIADIEKKYTQKFADQNVSKPSDNKQSGDPKSKKIVF